MQCLLLPWTAASGWDHGYPILARKSEHVTGMTHVWIFPHNRARISRISPDFDRTFCHWSSRLSCVASSRMPVTSAAGNARRLTKVTEAFRTAARTTERSRVPDILYFEFWKYVRAVQLRIMRKLSLRSSSFGFDLAEIVRSRSIRQTKKPAA